MTDHAATILYKLAKQMENVQMHLIEGSHAQALTEISNAMQFLKEEARMLQPKLIEDVKCEH